MSELIRNYLKSHTLSKETILEAVDEYTLYCFYLGFDPELKTRYSSPIRGKDDDPSFSIFSNWYGPCEFRWKDSARGISGDIFDLLKRLFEGLKTYDDVFRKIDQDFSLGFTKGGRVESEKIVHKARPVERAVTDIRILPKDFSEAGIAFWESFGITIPTLQYYNVQEVQYIWMYADQEVPLRPRSLCFAYREIDKYKLYQPFDLEFKFRNNYPNHFIEGFHQLKYKTDLLIITKSRKDVMCLYELGYESVSAKSENTLIPIQYLNHFKKRYKRIVVLFDNDMKHKGDAYEFDKIYVPIESGEKDVTDFRKKYGHDRTVTMLKHILT